MNNLGHARDELVRVLHGSAIVLVLILYLVLDIAYAVYTPTRTAPDETAHFNYVQTLAEEKYPDYLELSLETIDLEYDVYPFPEAFLQAQTPETEMPDRTLHPKIVIFRKNVLDLATPEPSLSFGDTQMVKQADELLGAVNQWFKDQFNGASLTLQPPEIIIIGLDEFAYWRIESPQDLWNKLLTRLAERDPQLPARGSISSIFVTVDDPFANLPTVFAANKGTLMMSLRRTTEASSVPENGEVLKIVLAHLLSHALGLEHSQPPGIIYKYPGKNPPPPVDDVRKFTPGIPGADWRQEITSPDVLKNARTLQETHFSPFPASGGSEIVRVLSTGFVTPERNTQNCKPLPDLDEGPVVITATTEGTKLCYGAYQADRSGLEPLVVVEGGGELDLGGATIFDTNANNGGVVLEIRGNGVTVKNGVVRGGWLGVYAENVARPTLEQMIVFDQRRMANLTETGGWGDHQLYGHPDWWLYFHLPPADHLNPFLRAGRSLDWFNYGAGAIFKDVKEGVIRGSFFTHQDIGTAVYGGEGEVAGNHFIDNYYGVRYWQPKKLKIAHNCFASNFKYAEAWAYWGDAAAIAGPTAPFVEIEGNTLIVTADGVFSAGTNGIPYLGGSLKIYGENKFYLNTAHGVEYTSDKFAGLHPNQRAKMGEDLVILNVGGLRVENNKFLWPWASGIWAGGSCSPLIGNNTFRNVNSLKSPFSQDAGPNRFANWRSDQGAISADKSFGVAGFDNRIESGVVGANFNGGTWEDWASFYSGSGNHLLVGNAFWGNTWAGIRTGTKVGSAENQFRDNYQDSEELDEGRVYEFSYSDQLRAYDKVIVLPPATAAIIPVETMRGKLTDDYTIQVQGEGFQVAKIPEGLFVSNPLEKTKSPQVKVATLQIVPNSSGDLSVPRAFAFVDFPFYHTQITLRGPGGEEVIQNFGTYTPDFDFGIARPIEGTSFSAFNRFSARITTDFNLPDDSPPFVFFLQTDGVLSGVLDREPFIDKPNSSDWFDTSYTIVKLAPGVHHLEISYEHQTLGVPALLRIFPFPLAPHEEGGESMREGSFILEQGVWQPARPAKAPRSEPSVLGLPVQSRIQR